MFEAKGTKRFSEKWESMSDVKTGHSVRIKHIFTELEGSDGVTRAAAKWKAVPEQRCQYKTQQYAEFSHFTILVKEL